MESTSTPNQAAAGPRVPPPRHKMALLTWAGAWAMITLILSVLGPVIATWPLPLQTLVVSVLMVLALTWVGIPALTRVFAGWLARHPRPQAGGTVIMKLAPGVRHALNLSQRRIRATGADLFSG
jgi:antibiotic biosynthesis monooxygenase (ABM) superfamily enzyme